MIRKMSFGNQFSFPDKIDITRIDLSSYCIGDDELSELTFQLSE